MRDISAQVFQQHCFHRRNFGLRAEEPIDDLLVILDLITPQQSDGKNVSRKIVMNKNIPTIVYRKSDKHGVQKSIFRITNDALDALRELRLIRWRYHDLFTKEKELNKRRTALLEKLLEMHDAMQIRQTLRLKKGVYQHFKGPERIYQVIDVVLKKDGMLWVSYQALYGDEREKIHERPLKMFTQVIYRDGYVGPRWKLLHEEEPQHLNNSENQDPLLRLIRK